MELKNNVVVDVQKSFTKERISDLLCCAFEGGSNYWYMIEEFGEPKELTFMSDRPYNDEPPTVYKHLDYPLNDGGFLKISDEKLVGFDVETPTIGLLNLETIAAGLAIMSKKYPRHFADWLNDSEDAITGDVFLQCCVLGDVIYG